MGAVGVVERQAKTTQETKKPLGISLGAAHHGGRRIPQKFNCLDRNEVFVLLLLLQYSSNAAHCRRA